MDLQGGDAGAGNAMQAVGSWGWGWAFGPPKCPAFLGAGPGGPVESMLRKSRPQPKDDGLLLF